MDQLLFEIHIPVYVEIKGFTSAQSCEEHCHGERSEVMLFAGADDAVLKILEEELAINEEIDRLVETKRQIREVINQVSDVTYRLILEKRNLLFETWRKIVTDMNLSERWAQIIHREAVKVVQGILDQMYPD